MTRRETKITDLRSLLDGTSQRARNLAALDPQSISIDERSDADLLAFVQKLTQHLIFTGPDEPAAARALGFAKSFIAYRLGLNQELLSAPAPAPLRGEGAPLAVAPAGGCCTRDRLAHQPWRPH